MTSPQEDKKQALEILSNLKYNFDTEAVTYYPVQLGWIDILKSITNRMIERLPKPEQSVTQPPARSFDFGTPSTTAADHVRKLRSMLGYVENVCGKGHANYINNAAEWIENAVTVQDLIELRECAVRQSDIRHIEILFRGNGDRVDLTVGSFTGNLSVDQMVEKLHELANPKPKLVPMDVPLDLIKQVAELPQFDGYRAWAKPVLDLVALCQEKLKESQ